MNSLFIFKWRGSRKQLREPLTSWEGLRTSLGLKISLESHTASEEAAVLGGPRIKLGEPWNQLGAP